jgi:hypothetical protein
VRRGADDPAATVTWLAANADTSGEPADVDARRVTVIARRRVFIGCENGRVR